LHSGYLVQPQNCCPACFPDLAVRRAMRALARTAGLGWSSQWEVEGVALLV
jgi:hypothetical protein